MKKYLIIVCLLWHGHAIYGQQADTALIHQHLINIISTDAPRNYYNFEDLNFVADYIYKAFAKYADTTYFQPYLVEGSEYKNVICVFGSHHKETIVVGAHYDVCDDQDGADDNASGVVGLLELARLLHQKKLAYRIEMVAYSLEEPPFFRTESMGSYIHAKSLVDTKANVYGMVCLEMIGYFDDAKGSQEYPIKMLSLIYGKRGNYITLVNKFGKGKFARKFSNKFKRKKSIKTKKFTGPKKLEGIDFSDHLNYWKFGISAVMITDTAFYRNHNYHETTDTIDTLDIPRMSEVINTCYRALLAM